MQIMKYVQLRLLRARAGRWAAIAEATGLSLSALKKIAYGYVEDPSVSTMQKLIDYFKSVERKHDPVPLPPLPDNARMPRVVRPRPRMPTSPQTPTASD